MPVNELSDEVRFGLIIATAIVVVIALIIVCGILVSSNDASKARFDYKQRMAACAKASPETVLLCVDGD